MADPQKPAQNAPQAGGPPKEERPGQQRRRRQSGVLYITILFAAAFALLLMTYAMDQRRSNETLGDLTSSVSDLKDSLSGMQTAQSALEENGALKNEIQDLQEQIDTLLGTRESWVLSRNGSGVREPRSGSFHRAGSKSPPPGSSRDRSWSAPRRPWTTSGRSMRPMCGAATPSAVI